MRGRSAAGPACGAPRTDGRGARPEPGRWKFPGAPHATLVPTEGSGEGCAGPAGSRARRRCRGPEMPPSTVVTSQRPPFTGCHTPRPSPRFRKGPGGRLPREGAGVASPGAQTGQVHTAHVPLPGGIIRSLLPSGTVEATPEDVQTEGHRGPRQEGGRPRPAAGGSWELAHGLTRRREAQAAATQGRPVANRCRADV